MSPSDDSRCPVCTTPLSDGRRHDQGYRAFFNCPQCSLFGLDTTVLDLATCKKIVDADILPTPQEAAENLIRWLGTHLAGPGDILKINFSDHGKFADAQSESGFFFVVDGLLRSGLLHGQRLPGSVPFAEVMLSFAGWERFEQLRRGTPSGRKAFMAMEYDDPILDELVNAHFRAAVAETGFVLRRLDDEPRAGLIDDRLRVEIQSSRFLIADLSHRNAGAYWEAGYAEGLGKPVIFTCSEAKFAEASHFDTNHHFHVLWDETNPEAATKKLKASIRATIPEATHE